MKELNRSNAECALRRVLDASPDMMFRVDSIDATIADCNDRLLKVLGTARNALLGKPFTDLFHAKSQADLRKVVDRFFATGDLRDCVLQLRTSSPEPVMANLNAAAICDETGAVIGIWCSMRDVTETHAKLRALESSLSGRNDELVAIQERMQLALAGGEIGTWEWVAESDTLIWDEQMHLLFGTDPNNFRNNYESFSRCLLPEDRERVQRDVLEAIRYRTDFRNHFQIERPDGEVRYIAARGRAYFDTQGKPVRLAGANWDVTAQWVLEEELRASESKLRLLYEHVPIGLVMRDLDGHFVQANDRYREIIEASIAGSWTPGHPLRDPERKILAEARACDTTSGRFGPYEERLEVGGCVVWTLFYGLLVPGADGYPRVWITSEDTTERKETEARLLYLTGHDALTGVANRRLFNDSLAKSIARAKRTHLSLAVMFIDLDQFKAINDTYGHDAGDEVLNATAARLRQSLREGDLVARFGGDEFAIIVESMDEPERSVRVAQRLLSCLTEPIALRTGSVSVTPSIGVALFPDCGKTGEELCKSADIAMYRAKEDGRNAYRFFSDDMQDQLVGRLRMESALLSALDNDEFDLHYQPQVDLASGRVTDFEALLRWTSPQLGKISPADFIPVLESSGMIGRVGEWVIRRACSQLAVWRREFDRPDLRVSVNLSASQLTRRGFVESIARALDDSGLPGRSLGVEITESMLMERMDVCIERLIELKGLKVSVSMDDFGTGYSSLQYLKKLPIDTLKIDRSFVRGIPSDPGDVAIVRATLGVAAALGLEVVAEGIETEEQLGFLRENGCSTAQGYLFSRPLPPSEIGAFLRSRPHPAVDAATSAGLVAAKA